MSERPPPVAGTAATGRPTSLPIPLSPDRWATLVSPFPLSAPEWDQLLATLAAMRPALVLDAGCSGVGRDDPPPRDGEEGVGG